MKIGLFTDTYHPQINGIVFVIDITKKRLEELGHEVYIICPGDGVRLRKKDADDHVIRFRSLRGLWFDDYNMSLFFPPREMRRIRKLNLDVAHFFTPSQVGLVAVYAAQSSDMILLGQHSTDLAHYIKHYPMVIPGLLLIAWTFPTMFKFDRKDARQLIAAYRPERALSTWGEKIVVNLTALVYSRCDAITAVSQKSAKQLAGWRKENYFDIEVIPTGVDALPAPTPRSIAAFRKKFGISEQDKIVLCVSRLGAEKNLGLLVASMRYIVKDCPEAKLVFVGDNEYRLVLQDLAEKSGFGDRIIFTGYMPRKKLGVAYGSADVFAFPSKTDTQGLVLHEAAHASLPLVIVDKGVSEVVVEGENGYITKDTAKALAKGITDILNNDELREQFSRKSKELAMQYSEMSQVRKLEALYEKLIAEKRSASETK